MKRIIIRILTAWLVTISMGVALQAQLINAGFESGSIEEVHSVHTDPGGEVAIVPNPLKGEGNPTDKVVKFLTSGDIPERAEIRVKGMDSLGEYWYGWQILLPSDWQPARRSDQGGGADIINQWHRGGGSGRPRWSSGHPMTINTDDRGNYWITWNYGGPDRVRKDAVLEGIHAFEDRGKWVNWAFHVKWAKEDNPGGGFMRLYHDGQLVFTDEGPNHENIRTWMMWKSGVYHGNPSDLPTDPYVIYGDNYIMYGAKGNLKLVNPYLQELPAGSADNDAPRGVMVEDGIRYNGTGADAKTLVIAYHKDRDRPVPAIVHFHGGGWRQGQASEPTAIRFAREGFVGISINYRQSHEAIFPAAVHDCKTAIRWARAHAEEYGIDLDRIGVFGGSAGGHLAAIVGMSAGDPYLEGDGPWQDHSSAVQAVAENYGPTDFLKMNDAPGRMDHDSPTSPESQFFGAPIQEVPEQVQRANPITYVDPSDPPILIIHGRNDMSVPFNQSEIFMEALQKAGVTSRLVPVENAGHGFNPEPRDAVINPPREEIEHLQVEWFKKHLADPRSSY